MWESSCLLADLLIQFHSVCLVSFSLAFFYWFGFIIVILIIDIIIIVNICFYKYTWYSYLITYYSVKYYLLIDHLRLIYKVSTFQLSQCHQESPGFEKFLQVFRVVRFFFRYCLPFPSKHFLETIASTFQRVFFGI